ncbi:SCO3242 family prenyltransferase [Streptomyces sp. NPDC047079]|uniref:SCO3242 family prenyltransferase n=1 Tax=Streptomyces sp. NPDC047079 TaxID=3154607 RepID=UPI0033DA1F5A
MLRALTSLRRLAAPARVGGPADGCQGPADGAGGYRSGPAGRAAGTGSDHVGEAAAPRPDRAGQPADSRPARTAAPGRRGSQARAWAELLRLPALFTVPGDALAGAAAVSARPGPRTLLAVGSSLCLYEAGMALNDWADQDEDAAERPQRPLPSGRIRPAAALAAAGVCTTVGLALAARAGRPALAVAAPLAATVWAYDLVLKRTPAGPAAMAVARGLDLLLGAVATRPGPGAVRRALPSAALLSSHTLAVTAVSRRETTGGSAVPPLAALATTGALTLLLTRRRTASAPPTAPRTGRPAPTSPPVSAAAPAPGSPAPAADGTAPRPGTTAGVLPSVFAVAGLSDRDRTLPRSPAGRGDAATPSLPGTCLSPPSRTPGTAQDALRAALAAAYAGTAARPYLHAALNPSPPLTQRAVGGGIRATIPLQAALCARAGAPAGALLTAALAPLAHRFAKKVSVT